jgi:hypothetical protein
MAVRVSEFARKQMLPCNRADRGCVASTGQHYLTGNGADFAMVFKLETICGTDEGSKANDGGASCWCKLLVQLPTRLMDPPPPCELAASQYRVGFRMLEPCDAKVSSTVLRGPGDRKVAWLLGKPGTTARRHRRVYRYEL